MCCGSFNKFNFTLNSQQAFSWAKLINQPITQTQKAFSDAKLNHRRNDAKLQEITKHSFNS